MTVNRINRRTQAQQRGIALVLVVIGMAMALILSLSFLSAQATSSGIARNVTNHAKARAIAESAMEIAIAEIRDNTNWRNDHPHGAWTPEQSLYGGTFTITVEDGTDTDGDGVVDGDGDLTDDTTEPVTVTVKATYGSTTHTVRAVVTGGSGAILLQTIAVADKVEVKGGKSGKPFIDSWDSTKGSYLSTKASEAIVSTNSTSKHKIKVKEDGEIRGDVFVGVGGDTDDVIKTEKGGKITGDEEVLAQNVTIPGVVAPAVGPSVGNVSYSSGLTTISSNMRCADFKISKTGIVKISGDVTIVSTGEFSMKDSAELQIAPNSSLKIYVASDAGKSKLKIEDSAKVNVTTDAPHRVIFYNPSKHKMEIKDTAKVYACFVMPSAELKIEDSAQVFGSSRTKSLKIEDDAQYHLDLRPTSVVSDLTYVDRGGADYGLAVEDQFEIDAGKGKGKGKGQGAPEVKGFGGTARVSTNSTYNGAIKVGSTAVINGDVYTGPLGNPDTVIEVEKTGTITGSKSTPTDGVTIPEIDIPDIGASTGDVTYSSGTTTLDSNLHVKKLTIKSNAILRIKGDVTIVVDEEIKFEDNAQITFFNPSSTLALYSSGKLTIENNSQINVASADPNKLTLYHDSTENVEMKEDAKMYAHVIVSNAEFKMKDQTQFFGTIRAYKVKMEDSAIANISYGIGEGPVDFGPASTGIKVQWLEKP